MIQSIASSIRNPSCSKIAAHLDGPAPHVATPDFAHTAVNIVTNPRGRRGLAHQGMLRQRVSSCRGPHPSPPPPRSDPVGSRV